MTQPKQVDIMFRELSPLYETLSWELVEQWMKDSPSNWEGWSEKRVIEHNERCEQRHRDGERAVLVRVEAFAEPMEDYFQKNGWTLLEPACRDKKSFGAQVMYRSAWYIPKEAGAQEKPGEVLKAAIGALTALGEGGFSTVMGLEDDSEKENQ